MIPVIINKSQYYNIDIHYVSNNEHNFVPLRFYVLTQIKKGLVVFYPLRRKRHDEYFRAGYNGNEVSKHCGHNLITIEDELFFNILIECLINEVKSFIRSTNQPSYSIDLFHFPYREKLTMKNPRYTSTRCLLSISYAFV